MVYDPTVNDLVNKALLLWAEIFSIDVESKSWRGTLGGWQLRRHAEELSQARDLDPSGLTTFMMLKALLAEQLQNITVKAIDFLRNHKQVREDLEPLNALLTLLESPEVVDLVEECQASLKAAAAHYGADMKKVGPYIDDLWNAAYVRRNALRSMETLEAHQFTQGNPQSEELSFNPTVYEFWNINSLIRAMRAQLVPGITLCLIRDPEALHSYFVFAIKNGDTITILTDRANSAHPLQKRMVRRPDRDLAKRAQKHHFPYELLDLEISEDQKHLWAKARTAIVPTDTKAVPLVKIKDLYADSIVWLTMVFELIREKFGVQNHQLPQLSYTGEMVADPYALVGEHGALVTEGHYKPLDLGSISHEELAGNFEDNWDRKPTGFNQWMVDRYGEQVPEEAFNLVGQNAVAALRPAIESGDLAPDSKDLAQYESDLARYGEPRSWTKNPHLPLEALDPMGFGSKEDLHKDRIWTAKYNRAKAIQRLADREYAEKRDEVLAWYGARIKARAEALIEAAVRGELILPNNHFSDDLPPLFDVEEEKPPKEANALRIRYDRLGNASGSWFNHYMGWPSEGSVRLMGGKDASKWFCYLTGSKATIFANIAPTCPKALAAVCGCEVEDLPIFLQHWYSNEPYGGNSILDRLDPSDWALKNPWMRMQRTRGLRLDIGIALSKSGWHRLRKKLGLPRLQPETLSED